MTRPGSAADPCPLNLQVEGVKVRLGSREVLQGIDTSIGPGWTAIVGPNGAGKSTLLRTLAGLQRPSAGRVALRSRHLAGTDAALHAWPLAQRARQLAWLAQQAETTGELTVRETVELGRIARLGLLGAPGPEDHAAVDRALAMTGCTDWQARRLHALSGGERQRVLLARVIATEAPVLLLDEPTTHLDAPHQVALARLFRRLVAEPARPRIVLTVLHDLPVALQADRLLVLERGRLRSAGAVEDPAVLRALESVFDQAIRIECRSDGKPRVWLDEGALDRHHADMHPGSLP